VSVDGEIMAAETTLRPCADGDEAALALVGQATFLETFAGILGGKDIVAHCANAHASDLYRAWLADQDYALWLAESHPGSAPIGYMVVAPPQLGSPPTERAPEHPEFLDSVRVTFEVSEYTKGAGDKQLHVMIGYGDSDCGLPVSISRRYTIYARRISGALRTSYCFGSTEYVRPQRQSPCPHGS
jgi:hypothetical protein